MKPEYTLQPQSLRSLKIQSAPDRFSLLCPDWKQFLTIVIIMPIPYLPIKAVDFVHPSAFMVASGKVYVLWEHDLVGEQRQNDFCRPRPSVHKVP